MVHKKVLNALFLVLCLYGDTYDRLWLAILFIKINNVKLTNSSIRAAVADLLLCRLKNQLSQTKRVMTNFRALPSLLYAYHAHVLDHANDYFMFPLPCALLLFATMFACETALLTQWAILVYSGALLYCKASNCIKNHMAKKRISKELKELWEEEKWFMINGDNDDDDDYSNDMTAFEEQHIQYKS